MRRGDTRKAKRQRRVFCVTASILVYCQRPVVRGMPAYHPKTGERLWKYIILKNVGRAPAFALVMVNSSGTLIGFLDVLEPLQPAAREKERPGRRELECAEDIPERADRPYSLYYQDVTGWWHRTDLRPDGDRFQAQFFEGGRGRGFPTPFASAGRRSRPLDWTRPSPHGVSIGNGLDSRS